MLSPGFLLLRESPSPSRTLSRLAVSPGLKSFAGNLELLKSWKTLRFLHKWLYRVGKTNTSAHRKSHKTSEGPTPPPTHPPLRSIESTQVRHRADRLDMKRCKCQGALQMQTPACARVCRRRRVRTGATQHKLVSHF